MKHIVLLTALAPTLAMAHPGHGGLGIFHHAMDGVVLLLVIGLIVAGIYHYNKR